MADYTYVLYLTINHEGQYDNGRFLQYVKDQTPELCWEAVKQNERVLKYVRDPILREQIKIHFNL